MKQQLERRFFSAEMRLTGDDKAPVLEGHAAVFNQLSDDLGGFRERIAPGAFAKALQGDVRALWNHNSDMVLGRNKAGTLTLEEDETGLKFRVTPPDTTWLRDRLVSIRRGDVTGCSFAFWTQSDMWEKNGEESIRTILEIKELPEISPGVTFPAYPQTDVAVRSLDAWRKREKEAAIAGQAAGVAVEIGRRSRELRLRQLAAL